MTKNPKSTKSSKNTKKAQKSSKKAPASQSLNKSAQASHNNQPKSWQVVVRLVIVGLLVLALGGSLFFGIVASAYSLPLQQVQRVASQEPYLSLPSEHSTLAQPALQSSLAQAGDRIDGQRAEDYAALDDYAPTVEAPMAALCTNDGRILFERNIDEQVTMASTTKIMTALVALETIALDTPLTVTYGAANTDGTDAGLEEGMVISLGDCLYALLLPSGNDAAVTIAENISGMESRFVELMNAKAAELGMTSTHYVDASGLSVEEHYTTVRDYLALVDYCMSNATFRQIVATNYYEANIGGTILEFTTTDALGEYLTVGKAIGVKTGYTDEAGYCFVGAADLDGVELYTVVFNASTAEQRFLDTATMLEWGFRHYRPIELINTSQQVADVALLSWIDKSVAAYVPTAVDVDIFDLNGPITQDIAITDIEGAAVKGQTSGKITWSQNGEVLTTSEVVVAESVAAPDFWQGIGIGWQRFWGGFSEEPAHMDTTVLLKNELAVPASQTKV